MRYLLAFISGLVLILSQPKFGLYMGAFGAFVPLLWAVKRYGQPFKLSFLAGGVYFYGLLYWLIGVMTHFGGLAFLASCGVLALLAFYLATFWGGAFWLNARLSTLSPSFSAALCWAAFMTLAEYLRTYAFTGFPWGFAGQALAPCLGFIQVADIGGVYLVSFLVFWINYALFALLDYGREALRLVVFTVFLVVLVFCYGQHRLHTSWGGNGLRVGLIQGNIPQDIKWDASFQQKTLRLYQKLTLKTLTKRPGLIVWPETALPFYFSPSTRVGRDFLRWSKSLGVPLMFGAPRAVLTHGKLSIYNSLFLVDKGKILGVYDKQHLVPFGEYIPLEKELPFMRTFAVASGDYSPGPKGSPLVLAPGKVFGPLICFESVFPHLARKRVLQGATMLVVVTNDAWFGRSAGPYQHFEAAVFRAVENRRYLIRCANTGISGVIAPTGQIVCATALEKTSTPCAEAKFLSYLTWYTRYGSYLPFFYLVLILPALWKSVVGGRYGGQ